MKDFNDLEENIMDAALNFLQGHQWLAWLLLIAVCGAIVWLFAVARKLDRRLTETRIDKSRLKEEVEYLLYTHRYIEPVTVKVKSLNGIMWGVLLRQGSRSTDADAAVRVQEKVFANQSYRRMSHLLYLDPKCLNEANAEHMSFIAVIDGALEQTKRTA